MSDFIFSLAGSVEIQDKTIIKIIFISFVALLASTELITVATPSPR